MKRIKSDRKFKPNKKNKVKTASVNNEPRLSECTGWTELAIPEDTGVDDDEGFGGIEELVDYDVTTIRGKRRYGEVAVKPTTKDVKKPPPQKRQSSNCDVVPDESLSCDMSKWDGLFVPSPILQALAQMGFDAPTPIQALTLPAAIQGRRDVLGAAETGSGKTLAFAIPLLAGILRQQETEATNERQLKALILTPTRELAIQVQRHIECAAKLTTIKCVVVVGGMAPQKQIRLLNRRPEIVVATPGRLWELMEQGEEHLSQLDSVRWVVVDEADRMTERGHFEELEKIMDLMKREGERQTFVFSATLSMVHDVPKRVATLNSKSKFKVDRDKKLHRIRSLVGMKDKPKIVDLSKKFGTVDTLTEAKIFCQVEDKDIYLYYFCLSFPGRTLVFCNSIDCVRRLTSLFSLLGCRPLTLHASMAQRQRLKNLDRFKGNPTALLLATDVAARGLDIAHVQHVVHYQLPRTAENYVHRSGRTARALNAGLSLMLLSAGEVALYRRMCKTLNRDKDLTDFPVDGDAFKLAKERVKLAGQLEVAIHRRNKVRKMDNWITQTAQILDVDLDEQDDDQQLTDARQANNQDKHIKIMQLQLKQLLEKRITPKTNNNLCEESSIATSAISVMNVDVANNLNKKKKKNWKK